MKSPTPAEEIMMEFPVWMFLIAAIVLALVIGRLGTILKEKFSPEP
ncbi:hypothetical protein OC498_00780 [Acinetobacter bohemicus]|nr:hypothetical protein [Acinetobacter bohemicus]